MSQPNPDRELPILSLLPNLVTIGAICAGLTAIRFAYQGSFDISVMLIFLACILDGIDGRLARKLNISSELGAELDSLADFLNFGVAPAMVIYAWAFQDYKSAGWLAVLFYAICCVLRLARFNVASRAEVETDAPEGFFIGVPAPAGALLVLLPMFLTFIEFDMLQSHPLILALYMAAIGVLMISRIPTYSFKNLTVYRSNTKFVLIGFALLIGLLISYPWATLLAFDIGYFCVLIWSVYKVRKDTKSGG
ncbi:MAG: CDP-diacylglycerol--serine O-phosphatidyltransferase [Rhodobacteraceae bacterium]|nr:MAG: CDP-diacylglycerol--serine O-phosphatidyltransferase [Paracoccaceae bacterium]